MSSKQTIYLGEIAIGTCSLTRCDPSMGVAHSLVEPAVESALWGQFLLDHGAEFEDGIVALGHRSELHIKDEKGEKIGALFCFLQYVQELNETWIEACGIHWQEFEERFPESDARIR